MHPLQMLLPKPDPYEKARRTILFLGAASLVMGVAKLFGAEDDKDDKIQGNSHLHHVHGPWNWENGALGKIRTPDP